MLVVSTDSAFRSPESSFSSSEINQIFAHSSGGAYFGYKSFNAIKNLEQLTMLSAGECLFENSWLESTSIIYIDCWSDGMVTFGAQSFMNCNNIEKLSIHSKKEIVFSPSAFKNSGIEEVNITWESAEDYPDYPEDDSEDPDDYPEDNSHASLLFETNAVTFYPDSFRNCDKLKIFNINTQGNVDIQKSTFRDCNLTELNIFTHGKVTVQSHAFAGCSTLDYNIKGESGTEISDDLYSYDPDADDNDDDDDDVSFATSSNKGDDDEDESEAKALGDIKIESVYLGASPNIYVNFKFLVKFMSKARKTFGKIMPAPELVHTAIWVGKKGATDSTVGAIFVYGKYWNKHKLPSYIGKTALRHT